MTGWRAQLSGRVGTLAIDLQLATLPGPTVVIGPNGAGKTTLLRALAGALLPLRGRVALGDRVFQDDDHDLRVPPEQRAVGYLPQGYGLFPHLTVAQNIAFGLGRGNEAKVSALMESLAIAAIAERRPATLSGGERQRVALARALAPGPTALLLDEPLAALDIGKRRQTRALIAARIADPDRTAIVVTHELRDVIAFGGRIVVIEAGRVVQTGDLAALVADPVSDFVAEFVDAGEKATAAS